MATKRKYEMRRRAAQVSETRTRIAKAAAELHDEVGPARTTVAEIARRAGVERLTVYKHFPTEVELFRACSAHWLTERPPPDLDRHSDIADPDARLRVVLRELYAWYWQNQRIVRHVVGDAATMPALAESLADLADARARNINQLLKGRNARGERRRSLTAALALTLDFHTCETLINTGLSHEQAAEVAAAMVAGMY
jgi:AcrR family transcriptional regulator